MDKYFHTKNTPFLISPKGGPSVKNSPVGYFSEGASLSRKLLPPWGKAGKGVIIKIKNYVT